MAGGEREEDMWGGRIGAAASGDESESAFTGILFGKGGRRDVVESIVSKVLSPFHGLLSLPVCPGKNITVVYLEEYGWFSANQVQNLCSIGREGERWIATDGSVW